MCFQTWSSWRNFRIYLRIGAIGAVFLSLTTIFAQELFAKEAFPKLGSLYISNKEYDQPSVQADIAKFDLAILGYWKGWNKNGKTIRQTVQEIKARNPNILLGNFTTLNQTFSRNDSADADKYNKVLSETSPNKDWWARKADGTLADSWFPGQYQINITKNVQPDSNGDRYSEWLAKRDWNTFFKDIPEFDIWYLDNWFWRSRTFADWDGDGANEKETNPAVAADYREGYVRWYNKVRTLTNMPVMGNVWVTTGASGNLQEPEYKNKTIEAALFEKAAGESWSIESWGGWEAMRKAYYDLMNNTKSPHYVLFTVVGSETDYQYFRYIFATSLLNNGYFDFSPTGDVYRRAVWFDEYDLAGKSNTSWLGKAIDPPPTSPWKNGIYRRDFENGIALVNPKGNKQQTINVEPGFRRIDGAQDPVINNGQPVTSITLKDRDGIILVRENTLMKSSPSTPKGLTITK